VARRRKVSKREALREIWSRGDLSYKRHDGQLKMRDYILKDKRDIIPILASRRLGKSFEMTVEAVELCMTTPNAIVKYVCPRLKMVKTIVQPNMRVILEDCPRDLRPEWKENDKMYVFPNGSQIQFAGTDNGSHENLRGGASHLCIVDEAGFCDHLEYVVNSILAPTTDTTDGKIVLISTPSKSANHDFITKFIRPAKAADSLLVLNIYDNPMLSERKIEGIAARFPTGKEDPQFKREYLCEIIQDDESVVIPEFTEERQQELIREWDRPAFYDIYTAGDVGFKDLTIYLFAYWDFLNAKLVIEDELVMNGPSMTTEALANNIYKKESEHFSDDSGYPLPVYMRVMDNNLIMVNDLQRLHGLNFLATAKDNKEAQINQVRMMISNNQIIINPRCKHLIYHVANGSWDKNHKEFARMADSADMTVRGGHADALDALIYLVRNLVRSHNPYPENWGAKSGGNVFASKISKKAEGGIESMFRKIMNIKN